MSADTPDPLAELRNILDMEHQRDGLIISVGLAERLLRRQECSARTAITGDEDGPYPAPIEIVCRKIRDHAGRHNNGVVNWERS